MNVLLISIYYQNNNIGENTFKENRKTGDALLYYIMIRKLSGKRSNDLTIFNQCCLIFSLYHYSE